MTLDKNPQKIKEMFDKIAERYDLNNNIISFGLHKYVKEKALSKFNFSGKVLDLCTGTGDIAAILNKNCEVIGVDFSPKMLAIARKKNPNIRFIEGDCTNLPFDNNSFDFVTISFGLRNIEDYNKALNEIQRVLKSGGKFFYLDFCKENTLANTVYNFIIPKLIKIMYKNCMPYEYLVQSKKEFFDSKGLKKLFEKHGFDMETEKTFLSGTILCQMYKRI